MAKKKVILTYPHRLVDQPVTSRLIRKYSVDMNILRARIRPNEEGRLVVEFIGKAGDVEKTLSECRESGLGVEMLAQEIKWHPDRCTHCTACVSQCPTGALSADRATMEVSFDQEECVACEICITVCPYHAMEILF